MVPYVGAIRPLALKVLLLIMADIIEKFLEMFLRFKSMSICLVLCVNERRRSAARLVLFTSVDELLGKHGFLVIRLQVLDNGKHCMEEAAIQMPHILV